MSIFLLFYSIFREVLSGLRTASKAGSSCFLVAGTTAQHMTVMQGLQPGAGRLGQERLTKPFDIPPADERAGERQERLMDVCSSLMSDAQSAKAV